jgi:hypothetical protein
MAQFLSLAGAAFVLIGFGGLQFGRLMPAQLSYQAINLVGASMLCASGLLTQTWGFVVLNLVWAAFAAIKLAEMARPRPAA